MVGEEKGLVFPPGVNHRFLFAGEELVLGPIGPESKGYLREGMKHLSLESLRNRFFGGKKEFSPAELEKLTALDGKNRFALGIIKSLKEAHGLGLIRMDRTSSNPKIAEVALTIIDEYQRQGLGVILMKAIIIAALEREVTELHFTYLNQNTGFEKLVRKFSPLEVIERDVSSVTVGLKLHRWNVDTLRAELRPFLPEI